MTTIPHKNQRSGKVVLGFILLAVGVLALSKTMGMFIPDWLFSWPMFLIAIGVVKGVKNNFKRPGAYIIILIGVIFLSEKIFSELSLHDYFWPVFIIGLGLYLIFGRHKHRFNSNTWNCKDPAGKGWDKKVEEPGSAYAEQARFSAGPNAGTDDYIDAVCVFGAVRKNIVSKQFRGGDIVAFMGGADINLSQADIQGEVILDVTAVFGGVKIVLPPNWKVVSEMSAVFGGIEDKRQVVEDNTGSNKLLILRGTSVFGGIEIKNF